MADDYNKDDPVPDSPATPKKVLVIEDDDSLANIYILRLEGEGFEVRRVASGEEAQSAAVDFRPDLAILDVMMPKVDGLGVLEILRNTPETSKLKIIVLSALDQSSYQQKAQELGAQRYLIKTKVTLEDIVNTAKDLINGEQKY